MVTLSAAFGISKELPMAHAVIILTAFNITNGSSRLISGFVSDIIGRDKTMSVVFLLAGGAYLPKGPWLKAIRQEIVYETEAFKNILNDKNFKHYFGEMEGEKLKTAPRDYPKDHPEIELLRHKSFLASHRCSDGTVLSDNFLKHAAKVFQALHPFDQFLNRAMD